jgi:hypothetical protein
LKINYFSSHELPKQQSTSFWSQGILGINECTTLLQVIPVIWHECEGCLGCLGG